jgi:hypothetical protein
MSRFRNHKSRFRDICASLDWLALLATEIHSSDDARMAVNALLALLPNPDTRWQAVYGMGLSMALLARNDMEAARVIMRRLMWSLNEESGNLGWGIPEAMGEILGASPALAAEYSRIFLSYGYETGKDDNYLDHPPLRRGVFWGMGRLAGANPVLAQPALPHLAVALDDDDLPARIMAAWALRELVLASPQGAIDPDALRSAQKAALLAREKALQTGVADAETEIFDGQAIVALRLGDALDAAVAVLRE